MTEFFSMILEYAKINSNWGFAFFLLAMAAMYYLANTVVGIFKWIAIAIKGHPPVGSSICSDCEED